MGNLVVVGTGIKTLSHLTEETKVLIRQVDKVLYLVNEPLLRTWIVENAKKAASLEPNYHSQNKRVDAYEDITQKIVDTYYEVDKLCVVFYGHPSVFAASPVKAVKRIKDKGGHAIILPAISAIDCLFSDLALNPGDKGYYSVDATDLLIYEKRIDPYSHLIIWQAYHLGAHDFKGTTKLSVLVDYLSEFYPKDHEVVLYEAPVYPREKPKIKRVAISSLKVDMLSAKVTLYLAPLSSRVPSKRYLNLLEMKTTDFLVTA